MIFFIQDSLLFVAKALSTPVEQVRYIFVVTSPIDYCVCVLDSRFKRVLSVSLNQLTDCSFIKSRNPVFDTRKKTQLFRNYNSIPS